MLRPRLQRATIIKGLIGEAFYRVLVMLRVRFPVFVTLATSSRLAALMYMRRDKGVHCLRRELLPDTLQSSNTGRIALLEPPGARAALRV